MHFAKAYNHYPPEYFDMLDAFASGDARTVVKEWPNPGALTALRHDLNRFFIRLQHAAPHDRYAARYAYLAQYVQMAIQQDHGGDTYALVFRRSPVCPAVLTPPSLEGTAT